MEEQDTQKLVAPKVVPGQAVQYVGSKGHPKVAIVLNVPETVVEGTSLPTLEEGQLHIAVWEYSSAHFIPKLNVPFFGNAEANEEGQITRFWQTA